MNELEDFLYKAPTAKGWKHVGVSPHHGIDIFLPGLRSEKSSGIGEFYDLLPIIDWCHDLKMDVIQLLPLNNSSQDPSPYNPISSCALNFIHLSLHILPHLDQLQALKNKLSEFVRLNKTQRILYPEVYTYKLSWLHAYVDEVGKLIRDTPEFEDFYKHNHWLTDYALFKSLRAQLDFTSTSQWPKEVKNPSQSEYQQLLIKNQPQIAFYLTMQFLCFTQLKHVKDYANSLGVFIKGDIPILVARESVDVWRHPEFFNLELSAGAPPDMYQPEGQNWGFPIYNWEAHEKDHFKWWEQRLRYATHFYDIYRIDHAIGFFRIWTIPLHHECRDGTFVPDDENRWESHGVNLLDMVVSASDGMLPIAEDLGVVPEIVPLVLKQMGICGTKVIRWERYWKETEHIRYIPYADYPSVSLTCVSTHDSETLTLWWRKFPEEAKSFALFKNWEFTPELLPSQHLEILWDSHHTPSLFHINLLQEYLALFPELVWTDPEDERINYPGTVGDRNWSYRYRPSVEEIVSHQGLKQAMEKILFSASPRL